MRTEKEIDDILDRYSLHIKWINEIIRDEFDSDITSERSAGRFFNMLIKMVCDIRTELPRTLIDLKPWMDD